MKFPILFGVVGGIVVAYLQYLSITQGEGGGGALLYYSPLFVFLVAVYMSIKKVKDSDPDAFAFKTGLKSGGITSVIMALILGIGVFIALTRTDVHGLVKYMIDSGQRDKVQGILSQVTRQQMFERAKFFTIPYFLLGFFVTLAVTMLFSKRPKNQ